MIRISIIIPVYNGEKYLEGCARSVLEQTPDRTEIIFVDDGSADGSAGILRRLKEREPRIQVITRENGGLSAARNTGMKAATGDYLAFLDCDDQWAADAADRLTAFAEEKGLPDVLLFDGETVFETPADEAGNRHLKDLYRTREKITGVLKGEELFLRMNEAGCYRATACMALFRRAYIRSLGLTFREGLLYEDNLFTAEALLKAEHTAVLAEPFYRRLVRENSIVTGRKGYNHARSAYIVALGLENMACGGVKRETAKRLALLADVLRGQAREIWGNLSDREIREGEERWPDGIVLRQLERRAENRPAAKPASGAAWKPVPVRNTAEPLVSVILPVHNAERVLGETLADLKKQRLKNFEMIFVDDGSTDGSAALLDRAAEEDPRIRVIRQENRFAGVARNTGMDAAKGKYLVFLDSDDRFDERLLAYAAGRMEETGAQAVIWNADCWLRESGTVAEAPFLRPCDALPMTVFSGKEQKENLFRSLNPWTKMYDADYIRALGLRYMPLYSSNDLTFTMLALARADRIAALPETLVHYRVERAGQNISATKSRAPLDTLEAFLAVKKGLTEAGLYAEFEKPFAAKAAESMLRSLDTFRSLESARTLYDRLRSGGWEELGLDALRGEDMPQENGGEILSRCREAREKEFDRYILDRSRQGGSGSGGRSGGSREAEELRGSMAYRIGTKITWLPHQAKKAINRIRRRRG